MVSLRATTRRAYLFSCDPCAVALKGGRVGRAGNRLRPFRSSHGSRPSAVSAVADLMLTMPTRQPSDPAALRVCRPRGLGKQTPSAAPGGGQTPPASAARHDRAPPWPQRKRSVRPPLSSSRRFQPEPAPRP